VILKPSGADVKKLPLSAVEAYVLSRLDGQLDLETVAEMTGLDADEVARVGAYLVELGAAVRAGGGPPAATRTSAGSYGLRGGDDPRAEPTTPAARRRDPRAEETLHPGPKPRTQRPPKGKTVAPPRPAPSAPKTMRPARGKTMAPPKGKTIAPPKTGKTVRPPRTMRPDAAAPADDDTLLAAIASLEARTSKGNHYEVLGVARDAEKKTIKRAYFALAAEAHPDRFFGKKIGAGRARVELVFRRITEAHDALTDPQMRRHYDARLPPLPKAPAPPPRKTSKGMKAVSRRMAAVKAETPAAEPPPPVAITAPPTSLGDITISVAPPIAHPSSVPAMRPPPPGSGSTPNVVGSGSTPNVVGSGSTPNVVASSAPPQDAAPVSARTVSAPKASDLRAGMLAAHTQARVDMLVKAGEEAMAANDIVTAANNYRLALEHRDDLRLRFIYEDLDARSRQLRFDKHMTAAKAAEREQRWADAAIFLQRAHEAKPDCDVAARAATALRLSDGDMQKAFALAEQAVTIAPRNPEYRLGLAVVCLLTRRSERAKEEADEARRLAPKDEAIQARARDIARKA
jgi:hypothetical protein